MKNLIFYIILILLFFKINNIYSQNNIDIRFNNSYSFLWYQVKITHNDKYILSNVHEDGIMVSDFKTGKELNIINTNCFVKSFDIHKNNEIIVVLGENFENNIKSVVTYNINTGEKIRTYYSNSENSSFDQVLFSEDGNYIIVGSGYKEKIIIYNTHNGTKYKEFNYPFNNPIIRGDVIFIKKKYKILTINYKNNNIKELNIYGKNIKGFSVSKNGNYLACLKEGVSRRSSDKGDSLQLFDVKKNQIIKSKTLNLQLRETHNLLYSPNDKYLVITPSIYGDTITFLNPNNLTIEKQFLKHYPDGDINISNDEQYLLISDFKSIIYNIETTKKVIEIDGCRKPSWYFSIILNNNNVFIGASWFDGMDGWSSYHNIDIYNNSFNTYKGGMSYKASLNAKNDEIFFSDIGCSSFFLKNKIATPFNNNICLNDAKFSFNGNYLVGANSRDSSIIVYDAYNKSEIRKIKINHKLENFALSHDNKFLLTFNNSNIYIWDFETNRLLKELNHKERIRNVITSNKYIFSYSDSILNIWDYSGNLIKSIKSESEIKAVKIISNENILLVANANKEVLFWNISKMKYETSKIISNYSVSTIENSDDSKFLFLGLNNGTIELWNIDKKKLLATITLLQTGAMYDENYQPITPLPFDYILLTPEGYFDGTTNGIKKLHIVKNMNAIPLESLYEDFYTPNLLARILAGEEFEEPEVKVDELTLPPLVEITAPSEQGDLRGFKPVNTDGLKSASKQIEVTVQATDQGGGIDEIRLFVNGKLVETTQRGFKPVVQNNQSKTKTFTISLTNGKNIIKATAFNNQRTESIADEITVFYEGQQTTSNLHLFVVGINEYLNPQHNLNYAVADATAFKEAIETNSKTIFGSVNVTFLTNENATKDKIMETFETLKSTVKQEDVFIFYYAGHGAMSVEDNPQFYIIPHNVTQIYGNNTMLQAKAISAEELKNLSMELPAQKQLFVFDACQSGGMGDIVLRGNAEEKAIAVLARATGTYWLTASGSDQYATEFTQIGHGVFTYAILLGLQGNADGGSHDKQITAKELDAYIQDKVPELSKQYKGQMQFPKSYGGGDDFPLIIIK